MGKLSIGTTVWVPSAVVSSALAVLPRGTVDSTETPGAASSTRLLKFEKLARFRVSSTAATEITLR
jgi:hypothetical protein